LIDWSRGGARDRPGLGSSSSHIPADPSSLLQKEKPNNSGPLQ
jgi:hypothetical protein